MIDTKKIWMNGEMIDHDNAKVHVLSHVLHYGSGFFEGIRAYETEDYITHVKYTEQRFLIQKKQLKKQYLILSK